MDSLTPAKASFLRDQLVPAALQWLSNALKVLPVAGPLKVANPCYQVSDISSTFTTAGVAADYVVFVTARATTGSTAAWAAYCKTLSSGRPYAAHVNFGPANIKLETASFPSQLQIFIHELTHALGFSGSAFPTWRNPSGAVWSNPPAVSTVIVNGVSRGALSTPTMLARARAHYGCPTMSFMELEESGGSGTAGSHWDARVVENDWMAGRSSFVPGYSAITLAALQDSGWYLPDFSVASGWSWGKNMGCGFVTGRCDSWPSSHFCSSATPMCYVSAPTYKGVCSVTTWSSALPSSFQYFSNPQLGGSDQMMDYCPTSVPYSNGDCRNLANAPSQVSIYGELYGSTNTICAQGNLLQSGYTGMDADRSLCVAYQCRSSATVVELWIGVGADYKKCSTPGAILTGFAGMGASRRVVCPNVQNVCPDPGSAPTCSSGSNPGEVVVNLPSDSSNPTLFSATFRLFRTAGGSATACATLVSESSALTRTVTGLTPGTTYGFCTQANAPPVGVSAVSATSSPCTAFAGALSSNNNLQLLTFSGAALSPAFAAATTAYTASVSSAVTSGSVTPTAADATASITVNGAATVSGSPSSPAMALTLGSANMFTVVVTAANGATRTITVTVTRAADANTDLAALTVLGGALSLAPAFANSVSLYSVSAPYAQTSAYVTVTLSSATSTLTVNGAAVASGDNSNGLALAAGASTTFAVAVTAQSGATRSITVAVTRAAASTNADLASLSFTATTTSPAFSASVTAYSATVPYSTSSGAVAAATAAATASFTVNGVATASTSAQIPLAVGTPNVITIAVTPEAGSPKKTYTLTVTRLQDTVSSLSALSMTSPSPTLTPAFAAAVTSYSAVVPFTTTSVQIVATASSVVSTMTINGVAVASGSPSGLVTLSVGANTVTISVTSQSGGSFKTTYSCVITRAASSVSTLSSLAPSAAGLVSFSPAFAPSVTFYTATYPYTTTSATLTPTLTDSQASVTVAGASVSSGAASSALPLTNVGSSGNPFATVVTAQSGASTTYSVSIVRLADSVSTLSALTVSGTSLSPAFSPSTLSYSAQVAPGTLSVTLTPTSTSSVASIRVLPSGAAVASGTQTAALNLADGVNNYSLEVTSQSQVKQTYSVAVTRLSVSQVDSSLSSIVLGSSVTLSPPFSGSVTSYSASAPFTVTSLQVAVSASSSAASTTIQGVSSSSFSVALTAGSSTTVTVVVTPASGSPTTYTVLCARAAASVDADIVGLTVSGGATLSPAFSRSLSAITATLPFATVSFTVTPTLSSSTASMTVNGAANVSGSPSASFPAASTSSVIVAVTAQSGAVKTLTITISRQSPSTEAKLASLVVGGGATINPAFSAAVTAYASSVSYSVSAVTILASPASSLAKSLTLNGAALASGVASAPISLAVGSNTLTTVCTAEDGVTAMVTTLTITRSSALGSDPKISTLSLSAVGAAGAALNPPVSLSVTPAFQPAITSYSLTPSPIPFAAASVLLTFAVMQPNTLCSLGSGAPSSTALSSSFAVSTVSSVVITCAAEDATTIAYTVSGTRSEPSSNSALASLSFSSGNNMALSPSFDPLVLSYTASAGMLQSVFVQATAASTSATLSGSLGEQALGAPGVSTTLRVTVTAENQAVSVYSIIVQRSSNATVTPSPSLQPSATPTASPNPSAAPSTPPIPSSAPSDVPAPGTPCPNACSGRGICTPTGVCICSNRRWTGADCGGEQFTPVVLEKVYSGRVEAHSYVNFVMPIATFELDLVIRLTSVLGDPDVMAIMDDGSGNLFPSMAMNSWVAASPGSDVLVISATDPALTAGDMLIAVHAHNFPANYTVTFGFTEHVFNRTRPCPFGCAHGTCLANTTSAICFNCQGRWRGIGCQIDDSDTIDVPVSYKILSDTGDLVRVSVPEGGYKYLYVSSADQIATLTLDLASANTNADLSLLVYPARLGHPLVFEKLWSKRLKDSTSSITISSFDSRADSAYYVGIHNAGGAAGRLRARQLATADVDVSIKMSNIDPSKLRLCPDDCAGGGTCVNGVCTGVPSAKNSKSGVKDFVRSTTFIAGAAVTSTIVLGVLAFSLLRKGDRSSTTKEDQVELKQWESEAQAAKV